MDYKKGVILVLLLFTALLELSIMLTSKHKQINVFQEKHKKMQHHALYHVSIKEKLIAFTFDDGPHPVYTRKILKILDKYHAKGTFFITGQRAQTYSSIVREMNEQGHEIGNHTFSHPSMRKITSLQLQEEIQKTDDIIHSLTGDYPIFFRPPGGVQNTVVRDAAKKKNHIIVIWSKHQDTKDWSNPGIEKMVKQVTQHAQPGQIVLMHDSGFNRTQTVKALEKILAILSKKGYKFVTVSELLHQSVKESTQ
ncbi:polysaccharide deacetylase family protein [Aneurinibacillus thermoaerophilus]|uniref:polysaccharide deacetylase family protein n=1 Tax=Aneurinibacillus thermoaerophilus TaxID=143495 RepID=UPI002E217040|nr:polysaccharide deacetylase family protein [Aneurinibacillus thermoaerophilus]MED0766353.1 polysaccharide deacetylase family protein [Aneurinibacillus thermoaerophilus]